MRQRDRPQCESVRDSGAAALAAPARTWLVSTDLLARVESRAVWLPRSTTHSEAGGATEGDRGQRGVRRCGAPLGLSS